jgi:hypothetical protein
MACAPDGYIYGGVDIPNFPWSNWAETIRLSIPRWLEPASLTDLVDVAKRASAAGVELHAVGSGWAFEDVALSRNWVVNLDLLANPLTYVLDSALTDGWRAAHDGPGEDKLFHVEAGIKIVDLNDALEAAGLGMITLGGANGQSLAGALSTSTHGADILQPPICDVVQAIHLVTVGGQEVWIERASEPLTTDARLRPVLPCGETQIRRDDDLFHAALVACGRFGVIYSVVLKVRPSYRLAEHTARQPVSEVQALLLVGVQDGAGLEPLLASLPDPPAALGADTSVPSRFLQIALTSQGRANCWITRRWPTTVAEDLAPTLPGPWCGRAVAAAILLGTATALDHEAALVALIPFVGIVWSAELFMRANELRLAVAEDLTMGEAAGRAITAAWRSGLGFVVPGLNETMVGNRLAESVRTGRRGPSHLMMTGGREGPDCFRSRSTELIFPGNTPAYLDYLSVLVNAGENFRQAGYISLRFSAPSRALISMHSFSAPYVVSIEVACLAGLEGSKDWVEFAERMAKAFGGRPHWGQEHHFTGIEVEQLYSDATLERWREALRSVSGTNRTFSNAFSRRCGLEPAPIPRAATVRQVHATTGPFTGPGPGTDRVYPPAEFGDIVIDLGNVELGEARLGVLAFDNAGASELQVGVAELAGDWGPADLRTDVSSPAASGESTEVLLIFNPSRIGPVAGLLTVRTSAQTTPVFRIALSGSAHGHRVTADRSLIDFGGLDVGDSVAQTLTVSNTGDRDGDLVGALLVDADPPGDFLVSPESATVPPGLSVDLAATYVPTRAGPARARLRLYLRQPSGLRQQIEVELVGVGRAPVVTLSPGDLVFPDVPLRRQSPWQSVEVSNRGTAVLQLSEVTSWREFEAMLLDASPLPPGQSRSLLVRFRPGFPGPRADVVQVVSNAPDSPHVVSCTGRGLATPLLLLDPPAVDFGAQPTATIGGMRSVRLTNDGVADMHIQSVQLTGADPADFIVEQPAAIAGTVLPPEAERTVGVWFTPTAIGSRSADLVVTSNAFGGSHVVTLTGHGIPQPPLTVTPTVVSFGGTPVGTRSTGRAVTVINNGTGRIELTEIRIGGADAGDFVPFPGNLPTVIPVGEQRSYDVVFAPTTVGSRSAELTFADAAGGAATVALLGTGTGSTLVFDPPEVDFGLMTVGGVTDPLKWVSLTNTGNVAVALSHLVIEGDFFGSSSCSGLLLGPGSSCNIFLRFRPSDIGPRIGHVVVQDVEGRVHSALLRGTGA